jgi:tetratricopeptide (TPR) repeat protein
MSLKQCCALGRCAATTDLKACAACAEVVYCCREHQVEHFQHGGHKMICPGRKKGDPLSFKDCADKATRYHESKTWLVALSYYSAILELTERTLGLFHPQVGNILQAMTTCYKMLEKFEEAAQCLQRVIIVTEIEGGGTDLAKSRDAFNVMGQMAELYLSAGNAAVAKELLVKMEEEAGESFGANSFEKGRTLCALGGCLERMGEVEEALATLQKALAIPAYGDCTTPADLVAASNCQFNLGVLLFNKGDKSASAHFRKSFEMKVKGGLPAGHADIAEVREYLEKAGKEPETAKTGSD